MDEFSLIQQYFLDTQRGFQKENVILGIGDDAAVLMPVPGETILFTTDTLIEGVHFPKNTSPEAIGHKSLAVNLSDIAAMAGSAKWFTLAISLPDPDPSWLKGFSKGLLSLARQSAVSLVGGDTTRGALSVTVSVIGTALPDRVVKRSTAATGDAIFITGYPGLAATGLASIKNEVSLHEPDREKCHNKLNYPQPRLQEGQFLGNYASSMIDVSDGLAADLRHILKASGCSAVLDSDCLESILPEVKGISDNRLLDAVLSGGDDYELLFTVPVDRLESMRKSWLPSYVRCTQIGRIVQGSGLMLREANGNTRDITCNGYNHFDE